MVDQVNDVFDILRPNNGLVFKLMPLLAAFYLGLTPVLKLTY
jgi:hypothetical protein